MMNAYFKCRCMPFVNQRLSITTQMNGSYKSLSHRSLTTLTRPVGLHRIFYIVIDNNKDIFDDNNHKLIKCRLGYKRLC
jgi:hypothetical protein